MTVHRRSIRLSTRLELALAARGFILVVSLLLSLVLLTMGLSASLLSMTNISVSRNTRENAVTRYRAEGGMDAAIALLKREVEATGEIPATIGPLTAPMGVGGAAETMTFTGFDVDSPYRYQRLVAPGVAASARISVAAIDPILQSEYVANSVISVVTEDIEYGLVSEGSITMDSNPHVINSNIFLTGQNASGEILQVAGTLNGSFYHPGDKLSGNCVIRSSNDVKNPSSGWDRVCSNTGGGTGTFIEGNSAPALSPGLKDSIPQADTLLLSAVQARINVSYTYSGNNLSGTDIVSVTGTLNTACNNTKGVPEFISGIKASGSGVRIANVSAGFSPVNCTDNKGVAIPAVIEDSVINFKASGDLNLNSGLTLRNSVVIFEQGIPTLGGSQPLVLENSTIIIRATNRDLNINNGIQVIGGHTLIASNSQTNISGTVTSPPCDDTKSFYIAYTGSPSTPSQNGIRFQSGTATVNGGLISRGYTEANGTLNLGGTVASRANVKLQNGVSSISPTCSLKDAPGATGQLVSIVNKLVGNNAEIVVLSRN